MNIKTGTRTEIELNGSFPALKQCRFCNHYLGYLTGPIPPHSNGVRCADCNRHLGWLPPAFDGEKEVDDFDVIDGVP